MDGLENISKAVVEGDTKGTEKAVKVALDCLCHRSGRGGWGGMRYIGHNTPMAVRFEMVV